jgi:hypothetical protein
VKSGATALALFVLVLCACSGGQPPLQTGSTSFIPSLLGSRVPSVRGRYYDHIVIDIQENRTFDNVFAGAAIQGLLAHRVDYSAFGYDNVCKKPGVVSTCGQIPLTSLGYESPYDPQHYSQYILTECNAPDPTPPPRNGTSPCRMNGFGQEQFSPPAPVPSPSNAPVTIAYSYLPPAEINPYIQLANTYGLADHLFSASRGPSFPGHVFLVSGLGPSDDPANGNWGCPSPKNLVPLFTAWTNAPAQNVSPCFTYPDITTELDAKHVTWKYYTYDCGNTPCGFDGLENALAAFEPPYGTAEYAKRVVNRAQFFRDVRPFGSSTKCGLPAVSWITPNGDASDHAGWENNADGPYWIATLYETIAQSPCYRDTAFLVVWDDGGGWFDHVAPPYVLTRPPSNLLGYRDNVVGFRVPLLFIAPNAAPRVSHTRRDFGAILGFIEKNFGLAPLGGEDLDFHGDALGDMFVPHPKATITPIPVSQIMLRHRKPYSPSWFLRQPPEPADDE